MSNDPELKRRGRAAIVKQYMIEHQNLRVYELLGLNGSGGASRAAIRRYNRESGKLE